MSMLPPYATRELISERLALVFPEGTRNRKNITNDVASSTIFAMLYIGAVEGSTIKMGPVHVYRMTAEQASLTSDQDRIDYSKNISKKGFSVEGTRWYADNTRESIRDDSLREGFLQVGVINSDDAIPTTSSKPRYSLKNEFAALFDPDLVEIDLETAISTWQAAHLSKSAMDRLALNKHAAGSSGSDVMVSFPNGETRKIGVGMSSMISKQVIEVFALKFLRQPVVLWLSTSGGKVVARDEELASSISLNIKADKDLPDIILVDLGPSEPLVVFVEVVATDGPMTERRQREIYKITDAGGFKRSQIAFVTAYLDRENAALKKTIPLLAWNSFGWFVSEPDKLVHFKEASEYLSDFIDSSHY